MDPVHAHHPGWPGFAQPASPSLTNRISTDTTPTKVSMTFNREQTARPGRACLERSLGPVSPVFSDYQRRHNGCLLAQVISAMTFGQGYFFLIYSAFDCVLEMSGQRQRSPDGWKI